jgi:hypothetical protein
MLLLVPLLEDMEITGIADKEDQKIQSLYMKR